MTKINQELISIIAKQGILLKSRNTKMVKPLNKLVAAIQSDLMQLGYILSEDLFYELSLLDNVALIQMRKNIIEPLSEWLGKGETFKTFWGDFPHDVLETSESEMFLMELIHYYSNGEFTVPKETQRFETIQYLDLSNLTELRLVTIEEFKNIPYERLKVNQSLSPIDLLILEYFLENMANSFTIPEEIPFKENIVLLQSRGIITPKTVNEVLKVISYECTGVSLFNWDILKKSLKAKKITRPQRKRYLGWLNALPQQALINDMYPKRNIWVYIMNKLRVGDYAKQFPNLMFVVNDFRNEKRYTSQLGLFYRELEKDTYKALKLLAKYPGVYSRKLNELLSNDNISNDEILTIFRFDVLGKISNKVLLELVVYFLNRDTKQSYGRDVRVKGKVISLNKELKSLDYDLVENVLEILKHQLMVRFSRKELKGNVWIDERLFKIPLPTDMRSTTMSLTPKMRGMIYELNPNTKYIRYFLRWYDAKGSEDLDASAFILTDKENFGVSFNTSLKTNSVYHSGDVRHVRGSVMETIEVDIQKVRDDGARYVIFDARNYEAATLSKVSNSFFGYMELETNDTHAAYIEKYVKDNQSLENCNEVNIYTYIYDVENNSMIIVNEGKDGIPIMSANYQKSIDYIKNYTAELKFSFGDLIILLAKGNNLPIVKSKEEADILYTYEEYGSSYLKMLDVFV